MHVLEQEKRDDSKEYINTWIIKSITSIVQSFNVRRDDRMLHLPARCPTTGEAGRVRIYKR